MASTSSDTEWINSKSDGRVPFQYRYPPPSSLTERQEEYIFEDYDQNFEHGPEDEPIPVQGWHLGADRDTTPEELEATGISHISMTAGGVGGSVVLTFIVVKPGGMVLMDHTGDSYRFFSWRSGEHAIWFCDASTEIYYVHPLAYGHSRLSEVDLERLQRRKRESISVDTWTTALMVDKALQ